jgi:transposase InsO family protein
VHVRFGGRASETGGGNTASALTLDPYPNIPMARGFLYLVVVMDWVSRYVVAWRLSNLLDASFCIEALEDALSQGQPEIFNTDQGSQFTGDDFTGVLRAMGLPSAWTAAGALPITSSSNGSGAASSMRRSCAVKALSEMGEGPPESACRSRFQTTTSCEGKEPWW